MMIRFLFEAGMPYLSLRTVVHENNADKITSMYVYMIDVLQATNKNLYAKPCVHSLHTYLLLTPELRTLWDKN